MADEREMCPSANSDPDDCPVSFLGRPGPAKMDLRVVTIPPHSELAYKPWEWAGALVVVEEGEIELKCRAGTGVAFGAGSILFFDGLGLCAVRNSGGTTALLSAVSRRATHGIGAGRRISPSPRAGEEHGDKAAGS